MTSTGASSGSVLPSPLYGGYLQKPDKNFGGERHRASVRCEVTEVRLSTGDKLTLISWVRNRGGVNFASRKKSIPNLFRMVGLFGCMGSRCKSEAELKCNPSGPKCSQEPRDRM